MVTVFELNDAGICCGNASHIAPSATPNDQLIISPGYALLTDQGITTGVSAQQRFWLEPQRSHNQFWRQLSLSPLPQTSPHARHFADLAYAQLQQLYRDCSEPEQIILAVPGTFSNEQLGILLGLAKASPFEVVGLVDAAVAASQHAYLRHEHLIHIDLQLHQAVITHLNTTDSVTRTHLETLPELGLKHFHDKWAQYIADQFIQQYRYDPLHTAAGEQQLNNQLPQWLNDIAEQERMTITLQTPQGDYRLKIEQSALLNSARPLLQQLENVINHQQNSEASLVLSHRCLALPGIKDKWPEAIHLTPSAAIAGCLSNPQAFSTNQALAANSGSVQFMTSLPANTAARAFTAAQQAPDNSITPNGSLPTHLLQGNHAWSLQGDLPKALKALTFESHNGKLTLSGDTASINCSGDVSNLKTGDTLTLENGDAFVLIEVC